MSAQTLNIPANGAHAQSTLGRFQFFFVRFLSKPAEISFDGTQWQPVQQNDRFTRPEIPTRVFFRSADGLASLVTFQYSLTPFSAQDTALSPAATVAVGNLGIPNGTAAAGGLPQCDSSGYLHITDGMNLLIPGSLNGSLRQKIVFTKPNAGINNIVLSVMDVNGNTFMLIPANHTIVLDTSDDFIISGVTNTSWVTIGQIFNA
jgi:hypothetical protein